MSWLKKIMTLDKILGRLNTESSVNSEIWVHNKTKGSDTDLFILQFCQVAR